MTHQDRAAVMAMAIAEIVVWHDLCISAALVDEIATMLRKEFHEIQQQTLNGMRPEGPHPTS